MSVFASGYADIRIGLGQGFNTGGWAAEVHDFMVNNQVIVDLSAFNVFVTAGQTFVLDISGLNNGSGNVLRGTSDVPGVGALYYSRPSSGV